jgi:hypothetical protein
VARRLGSHIRETPGTPQLTCSSARATATRESTPSLTNTLRRCAKAPPTLPAGSYVVYARSVDRSGAKDATPAKRGFRVKRGK